MADNVLKRKPAGLAWLIDHFALKIPAPTVRSEIISSTRRTTIREDRVLEQYPPSYAPTTLIDHLRFALRYEPLDLRAWNAILHAVDRSELQEWIRDDRSGRYARRAWYLYEAITGTVLDIEDTPPTGYVDLADPKLQMVGPVSKIQRQRINLNLLGDTSYAVLIRRTEKLTSAIEEHWNEQARQIVQGCDPSVLARAVHDLFTRETKSSFAIEGEVPSSTRAERFVAALENAAAFDASKEDAFAKLQNTIVDSRYAQQHWRINQNYVGQTRSDYSEQIYFVCPKPQDVSELMNGWMRMTIKSYGAEIDAVCAAAAVAFGFVFIHPFDDGNGRIHRFLVHHVLARRDFTPPNLLFPVSAVMLRDRRAYDAALKSFSSAIAPFIQWSLDNEGQMTVSNDTADLYRYWDATPFAEYLYRVIAEIVRRDLADEIKFLSTFDAAVRRTMDIVDMPDRRASLLVRLILQNNGALSAGKRPTFKELSDQELTAIEGAIRELS